MFREKIFDISVILLGFPNVQLKRGTGNHFGKFPMYFDHPFGWSFFCAFPVFRMNILSKELQ